ncbi:MAG: NUDIX hydrolase [Candidatus Nanohaloarchaeota archaeon QJJ-5]|nr:NUDIX hydrolase [Candidatus Nanohaloarchaeota archaeon QJJ-5]
MDRSQHRVTVDAIIRREDKIVLIRRGADPYKGTWALPGGHVDAGETPKEALKRELREETGLSVEIDRQLGEHAELIHDPRGPVIPITYYCSTDETELDAGTDAAAAVWREISAIPDELAFGHHHVLEKHLEGYPSN